MAQGDQSVLGNRIVTTTRYKLMPFVVDTVLNSNVLGTRILTKAKKWSGNQMLFPIKYNTNTTGTSFAGFDTFSTAASDTRVNMTYNPSFYQITVAIPQDELSVNNTPDGVMSLMAVEIKSSAEDMADALGTMFYQDGTGNSGKDFLGLGAIVDDGTTAATIGGLSRSTYTTLKGTITNGSGTLSLAKMSTLYNNITAGAQIPTCGFTTQAIFSLYESLLQPQERVVKDVSMVKEQGNMTKAGTGFVNGTGYTGLYFKGFPILADQKASNWTTSSTPLIFLNEDYVDWYGLPMAGTEPIKMQNADIRGNDYGDMTGYGFSWTNWIKPTNAAALVSHVFLGGQFLTDNPKRQGALYNLTSF